MKTKNITINIPEEYDDVRFNEKTNEIEFIKKDDKPRSWKEYCETAHHTDCYRAVFSFNDDVIYHNRLNRLGPPHFNEFNTEEEAKAVIALCKLIQLRDAWWGGWKPDWEDGKRPKYMIYCCKDKLDTDSNYISGRVLSFPTPEMRDDFFETFRDLIEEAKSLL